MPLSPHGFAFLVTLSKKLTTILASRQETECHTPRYRLLAGYSVWYYAGHSTVLSTPQGVQLVVAKLILFSVLYYALVWVGRNYRASPHNSVVDKHRQNALSSFEAFAKAASDEATKNAVLLGSTEVIFSPESTGYLTKEPEPPAASQILEIIRGAARKDV